MTTIDITQIRELAQLSRLSLREGEAEAFREQLARVIGYVEQLQAVDVDGIQEFLPPTRQGSALRRDEPGLALPVDEALAPAAARRQGHVSVPKFKED